MNKITAFVTKITESFDLIAKILFMVILFLVVCNVILRFFRSPINGCYEWVGFIMASAIGCSLGYCALQDGHVAVTILIEKLKIKTQYISNILKDIVILAFLIMVSRVIFMYGNRMFLKNNVGMTTQIPLFYFVYIIALGFIVYCIVVGARLIETIRKGVKK